MDGDFLQRTYEFRRKRADVFRYDERNKSIADRIRATRRMQPFAGISAHSHTDDMAYGSHARGGRIFAYIYRTMAGAYAFVPVSGQSGEYGLLFVCSGDERRFYFFANDFGLRNVIRARTYSDRIYIACNDGASLGAR